MVQFFYVGLRHCRRPLRTLVRHSDSNDLAFAVYGDGGMVCQILPGVFHAAVPIEFLQVKLLDEFVLRRAAAQDADKDVARALEAKEITGDTPKPAGAARHRGSRYGETGSRRIIGRHQMRRGFEAWRDKKSEQRTGEHRVQRNAAQLSAMSPQKSEMHDSFLACFRRLQRGGRTREVLLCRFDHRLADGGTAR